MEELAILKDSTNLENSSGTAISLDGASKRRNRVGDSRALLILDESYSLRPCPGKRRS